MGMILFLIVVINNNFWKQFLRPQLNPMLIL